MSRSFPWDGRLSLVSGRWFSRKGGRSDHLPCCYQEEGLFPVCGAGGKPATATWVWRCLSLHPTPGRSWGAQVAPPSPSHLMTSVTDLHGTSHRVIFKHLHNLLQDFRSLTLSASTEIRNTACNFSGCTHCTSVDCNSSFSLF